MADFLTFLGKHFWAFIAVVWLNWWTSLDNFVGCQEGKMQPTTDFPKFPVIITYFLFKIHYLLFFTEHNAALFFRDQWKSDISKKVHHLEEINVQGHSFLVEQEDSKFHYEQSSQVHFRVRQKQASQSELSRIDPEEHIQIQTIETNLWHILMNEWNHLPKDAMYDQPYTVIRSFWSYKPRAFKRGKISIFKTKCGDTLEDLKWKIDLIAQVAIMTFSDETWLSNELFYQNQISQWCYTNDNSNYTKLEQKLRFYLY